MQVIKLDNKNINQFRPLIKDEVFAGLNNKKTFACGVNFLGGPQGVCIWDEHKELADLKYIYVTEECRNMGIGTAMIRFICAELYEKGIGEMLCEYSEQDNRKYFTDFFESLGAMVDVYTYPYGSITFENLKKAAKENGLEKLNNKATPIRELVSSQRKQIADIVLQETGEELSGYVDCPLSLSVMSKDEVKGFVLARQEGDVYHFDYCYAPGSQKTLGFLFAGISEAVDKIDNEDGVLDMILTTPQSKKLYERFSDDIADIKLVHASVDTRMVVQDAQIEESLA